MKGVQLFVQTPCECPIQIPVRLTQQQAHRIPAGAVLYQLRLRRQRLHFFVGLDSSPAVSTVILRWKLVINQEQESGTIPSVIARA